MWIEKNPEDDTLKPKNEEKAPITHLKRDAWMEEAGMDIDYTQRGARNKQDSGKTTASSQVVPDWQVNLSSKELNIPLKEGYTLDTYNPPKPTGPLYKFGDAGSDWRMRKLKNVYRRAEEDKLDVDKIGTEVFGSLQEFDEAREERQELDRREIYGTNRKDFKEYPTGDLYNERNIRENSPEQEDEEPIHQGQIIQSGEPLKPLRTVIMDQSALNKLRASLMKAQLRGDSKAAELEAEYNLALANFSNNKEPEVVVLSAMDSRLLAGGSRTESTEITTGKNKGKRETNHDMSVDDMVREEKRTRGQVNEGKLFAERIAKDGKYDVRSCFPLINRLHKHTSCIEIFLGTNMRRNYRTIWNIWMRTLINSPIEFNTKMSTSRIWQSTNSKRCKKSSIHVRYVSMMINLQ